MVRIYVFRICRETSCHSRSKFNLKVKNDFSTNKGRNNCNTSFLCNFDCKIHFWYQFCDWSHPWRQKVNFKVKRSILRSSKQRYDFYQIKLETSVIPHFRVILPLKSISGNFLVILRHPQGQKVNFRVKYVLAYGTLHARRYVPAALLQVFMVSFEI